MVTRCWASALASTTGSSVLTSASSEQMHGIFDDDMSVVLHQGSTSSTTLMWCTLSIGVRPIVEPYARRVGWLLALELHWRQVPVRNALRWYVSRR